MSISAAVDKEAVGVVTIGQVNREGFDAVRPQTLGELAGCSLPAAVVIGVESQVDGTQGAVAQLMKLSGIQACPERAGDVAKTCLPQDHPIEQAFHQHDLAAVTNLLPAIQSTLAAGQESMRAGLADAASVKVGVEWKDDAMGECIEAFQRDNAGLLQIVERIAHAHQAGP